MITAVLVADEVDRSGTGESLLVVGHSVHRVMRSSVVSEGSTFNRVRPYLSMLASAWMRGGGKEGGRKGGREGWREGRDTCSIQVVLHVHVQGTCTSSFTRSSAETHCIKCQ